MNHWLIVGLFALIVIGPLVLLVWFLSCMLDKTRGNTGVNYYTVVVYGTPVLLWDACIVALTEDITLAYNIAEYFGKTHAGWQYVTVNDCCTLNKIKADVQSVYNNHTVNTFFSDNKVSGFMLY